MTRASSTKALLTLIALILVMSAYKSLASPEITANAQASGSDGRTRTFLGGQLDLDSDFQPVDNKSFTYRPVQPLAKHDALVAMVSSDQAWSVYTAGAAQRSQDEKGDSTNDRTSARDVGAVLAKYPVVGMVKTSDGNIHWLYPAVLKAKTDIQAGKVVQGDGYQIETERSVKAGDSISVLVVGGVILSIEGTAASKPWFTASKNGARPNDRASAIKAWRIEKAYVGE